MENFPVMGWNSPGSQIPSYVSLMAGAAAAGLKIPAPFSLLCGALINVKWRPKGKMTEQDKQTAVSLKCSEVRFKVD